MEPIGGLVAQYDYKAGEVNELSFGDGQALFLLSKLEDDGWWLARINGKDGLVPSNYVVAQSEGKDVFTAILAAPDQGPPNEEAVQEGEQAGEIDEQACGVEEQDPELHQRAYVDYSAQEFEPQKPKETPQSPQPSVHSAKSVKSVRSAKGFSAQLHLHQGQKPTKGQLLIEEDELVFIDRQGEEFFRVALNQVISYNERQELLLIRNLPDPVRLCLKEGVKQLQAAIHAHPISPRLPQTAAPALGVEVPQLPPRPAENSAGSSSSPSVEVKVRALYAYEPVDEDELRVEEGEELLVVDKSSTDWWLLKRLHGSHRQGLVPRLYVQEVRNRGDEGETIKPGEKPGRPTTPRPAFLDELLQKRQRVSIAEESVGKAAPETVVEEKGKKVAEKAPVVLPAKGSIPVPAPPPLPKQLGGSKSADKLLKAGDSADKLLKSGQSIDKLAASLEKLKPKSLGHSDDKLGKTTSSKNASRDSLERKASMNGGTSVNWQKPAVAISQDDKPAVDSKPTTRQLVPKEVLQKSTFKRPNSPRLKPEAAAAISAILERGPTPPPTRRTDKTINLSNLKHVSPIKKVTEGSNKPNPWSSVTLKKTSTSETRAKQPPSAVRSSQPLQPRAQPSRPDKAASADKPQPGNCRLWTNRSGQFQVEAEYLSYAKGQVTLHKLNGNRIQVPLSQLCERDCEFVHRKEGLPYTPPAPAPVNHVVNGHDWQAFFASVHGLDAPSVARYAKLMAGEGLDQRAYSRIDRAFLQARSFNPAHLEPILNHLSRLKLKQAEQTAALRNLSALAQEPAKEAPRRPSAVFQEISTTRRTSNSIKDFPSLAPKPAPTNPSTMAQLSGLQPTSPKPQVMSVSPPSQPYTYTQSYTQSMPPPADPFASLLPGPQQQQQAYNSGYYQPMPQMMPQIYHPMMSQMPQMQGMQGMSQMQGMQGMPQMQGMPNMAPMQNMAQMPHMAMPQGFMYGQPQVLNTTTTTTMTNSTSAYGQRRPSSSTSNHTAQPYADPNAGDKYAILKMIDPQGPGQYIEEGQQHGSPNLRRS